MTKREEMLMKRISELKNEKEKLEKENEKFRNKIIFNPSNSGSIYAFEKDYIKTLITLENEHNNSFIIVVIAKDSQVINIEYDNLEEREKQFELAFEILKTKGYKMTKSGE